jgi:hypothetical protein
MRTPTPDDRPIQVNLRIRANLQGRLERAARENGTSVNNEMRTRLERSFELQSLRTINDVVDDLELNAIRLGELTIELQIGNEILTALEARDFDKARALAIALRRTQETTARKRAERLAGGTS